MHTKLTDIYEIRPGQQIIDMSADQKTELFDAATSTKGGKKRGLIITFDLSSSFRLTNNRLYSAKGQQAGLSTWTAPYPKPILRNHDTKSDPIGRIISVEWVSNDQEAMRFFENTQDFMAFKRVLDSGNVQKIYKEMLKRNLLTDDRWPGMGKLVAKARISDADAIEKFLDGRYLTFSAGSHTDKYCCGLCGSDWATGDVCDHLPGSIDDEGRPVVMFTGIFAGREASVVTTPGNDLSQLTNMEFGDSIELAPAVQDAVRYDRSQIAFTDASVDTGDIMAEADTPQAESQALDTAELIKQLLADEDALAALKTALVDDKETDDAGNQEREVEGSVQEPEVKPNEVNEDEETQEEVQQDEEEEVKTSALESLDWYLLGLAFTHELGDAALDDEATAALDEKAFIGPEKTFPVADADHLAAARRVLERARLTEDQKAEFESALTERIETFSIKQPTEQDARIAELEAELTALKADYQQSLKVATDLQTEVDSMKEKLAALDTSEETSQNDDKNVPSVEDIKPVEDESASSSQALTDSVKELGDYEKKIVSRFKELRDQKGERAAQHFLHGKIARGHLPRTFDITPHIQENE